LFLVATHPFLSILALLTHLTNRSPLLSLSLSVCLYLCLAPAVTPAVMKRSRDDIPTGDISKYRRVAPKPEEYGSGDFSTDNHSAPGGVVPPSLRQPVPQMSPSSIAPPSLPTTNGASASGPANSPFALSLPPVPPYALHTTQQSQRVLSPLALPTHRHIIASNENNYYFYWLVVDAHAHQHVRTVLFC
jgi:hypothetical protein